MIDSQPGFIDIGHGVRVRFLPTDGEPVGLEYEHPCTSPGASWIPFRGGPSCTEPNGPSWELVSKEPLTLAPSLLCRTCGHHGFIRSGEWVPA